MYYCYIKAVPFSSSKNQDGIPLGDIFREYNLGVGFSLLGLSGSLNCYKWTFYAGLAALQASWTPV